MGIKGLLQFLKDQQQIVNIKSYRGCTAAVDVYCWLHRAVYGCVDQIAIAGNDQGQYITYCEKYWNLLKSNGIKPILVFDGQNLPAKSHTEKDRRERRKANRDKATALLAEGKRAEARIYFERCIDITPHMAHKVIVAAVSQGIDCIVAPYEADAQLAYLSQAGIAQLIISEDSDLLCFGCERVMFKLDLNGNGIVQELSSVLEHKSFRKRFTFDSFLKMCVMSGCDYLPSLPGIGLAKATKFMSQNYNSTDIRTMLRRLPLSVKLPSGAVTDEYIANFISALMAFKHQVVFDPVTRTRRPLTLRTDTCCGTQEHPEDMSFAGKGLVVQLVTISKVQFLCKDLTSISIDHPELFALKYFPTRQALQIALGNVNLHNMETLLPEIDPDLLLSRENGKLSIWHPQFKPKGKWNKEDFRCIDRDEHSTKDKSVLIPTDRIVRKRRLSQTEAQEIVDGLCTDNTFMSQTAADGLTPHHGTMSPHSYPGDGFSSVEITPKQTKVSEEKDDVFSTSADEDFDHPLDGPSAPSQTTTGAKANRFMKDKMRSIYHTENDGDQSTPTVKSRYFGATSTPVSGAALDSEEMEHCESLSGVQSERLSQSQSQEEDRSQSELQSQEESLNPSEYPPLSQTSTDGVIESSSSFKYRAKFLGALEKLDSQPSPQSRAFRWSKSSIHNADSSLTASPTLSQQFKSPLLKSRLAQITAEQNSTSLKNKGVLIEEMPSLKRFGSAKKPKMPNEGGVQGNPFRKSAASVDTLLGIGLTNPFRKSTSETVESAERVRSVLGGAAVKTGRSSGQEGDNFGNDTLRRIGTRSDEDKKSFITQKLTAFQLKKSSNVEAKPAIETTTPSKSAAPSKSACHFSNGKDTVSGDASVVETTLRSSLLDTHFPKSKRHAFAGDAIKLSSKDGETYSDSDCEFVESEEILGAESSNKNSINYKPRKLSMSNKAKPITESLIPDSTFSNSEEATDLNISESTDNELSANSAADGKDNNTKPKMGNFEFLKQSTIKPGRRRQRSKAGEQKMSRGDTEEVVKISSVSAFLSQFAHKKSSKLVTETVRHPLSTSPTENAQLVDLT